MNHLYHDINIIYLNTYNKDRQWNLSVHDVDYESFDSMFWIEVRRVKKSQFDAVQMMLECYISRKVDHAKFSSTWQLLQSCTSS